MPGVKCITLGIINRWCGNKWLWKVHAAVSAEENVFYRLYRDKGRGQQGSIGLMHEDG